MAKRKSRITLTESDMDKVKEVVKNFLTTKIIDIMHKGYREYPVVYSDEHLLYELRNYIKILAHPNIKIICEKIVFEKEGFYEDIDEIKALKDGMEYMIDNEPVKLCRAIQRIFNAYIFYCSSEVRMFNKPLVFAAEGLPERSDSSDCISFEYDVYIALLMIMTELSELELVEFKVGKRKKHNKNYTYHDIYIQDLIGIVSHKMWLSIDINIKDLKAGKRIFNKKEYPKYEIIIKEDKARLYKYID